MTVFIIVCATFFVMSLIFGMKFAKIVLKLATASAIGGCVWFVAGLMLGYSSLLVFLIGSIVAFVLIEFLFGD